MTEKTEKCFLKGAADVFAEGTCTGWSSFDTVILSEIVMRQQAWVFLFPAVDADPLVYESKIWSQRLG